MTVPQPDIAEKLQILAGRYNATLTQVLLGFFTCQGFTCLPLYGPRSAKDLQEAMNTFEIPFEKDDYQF